MYRPSPFPRWCASKSQVVELACYVYFDLCTAWSLIVAWRLRSVGGKHGEDGKTLLGLWPRPLLNLECFFTSVVVQPFRKPFSCCGKACVWVEATPYLFCCGKGYIEEAPLNVSVEFEAEPICKLQFLNPCCNRFLASWVGGMDESRVGHATWTLEYSFCSSMFSPFLFHLFCFFFPSVSLSICWGVCFPFPCESHLPSITSVDSWLCILCLSMSS